MAPPLYLIANPKAGAGRARRMRNAALKNLARLGFKPKELLANAREEVCALAVAAGQEGATVVALGGDGLAAAVAEGLREAGGGRLALIPAGRGNDLARSLGIPLSLDKACALIAEGPTRTIDLGEVGGRIFVGIAYAGFDSEANRIANELPFVWGRSVYTVGALRALAGWRPVRFTVAYRAAEDGALRWRTSRERAFAGYSVVIANTPYYGAGMKIAPRAAPDDGVLELITVEQMGKGRFLANLPRVFRGSHLGMREVEEARCLEATVHADRPFVLFADGDPIASLPARIRIHPHALIVIAPPAPVAPAAPQSGREAAAPR